MKRILFIFLFLHLSMFLHAQVFNKAYNNYYNVLHRPDINEYSYNLDVLYKTIPIVNSDKFVSFGNTTTPLLGSDTTIREVLIIETDSFGDTILTSTYVFDTFNLNYINNAFSFNSNFILIGRVKDSFNPSNALVLELDTNYNMLSYQLYDYGNTTLFFDYAIDKNEFFYVSGNAEIDTSSVISNYEIFITKFDSNLNAVDTFQIGYNSNDYSLQIEILDNKNLLLCGYTFSIGAGDEDIYLVEIDTLGNIVWEQTYGYPGTDRVLTNSCFVVNNQKEIYIVGSTELMDGDRAGWLIKTDSVGNMLWEKKYNWGVEFDALTSIKLLDDENLIVMAGTHDYSFSTNPSPIMRLLRMDTAGNIIWERKLSRYGLNTTDDYAFDLDIMDDGFLVTGYVIAGHVQTNGIFHLNDGWLCKTDSCGFTTDAQPQALLTVDSVVGPTVYITNLSEEYCTANLALSNGDSLNIYAYSQWTNGDDPTQIQYTFADTGNYNVTLYTYAGDGIDTFSTQVEVKDTMTSLSSPPLGELEGAISVYPNPANDYIILQTTVPFTSGEGLGMGQTSEITGTLYTITGQKVHDFTINPKLLQQKIALPDLNNGVYFLKIKTKNYMLTTERISVVK